MTTPNEGLATVPAQSLALQESTVFPGYTNQQVDLIKTQIAKGASDEELKMFMFTAKRLGLDPFGRQIYLIPRWDNKLKREVRTPQVSIDGFRLTAVETGELGGIDDAKFYDENGNEGEIGEHPFKASVTVYRIVKGVRCPFTASARWEEYKQETKDHSTGEQRLTSFWQRMPFGQLAKCAESLALRKAFPKQLGGVYTTDEMAQATTVNAVEVEPTYIAEPEDLPLPMKPETAPEQTVPVVPVIPNHVENTPKPKKIGVVQKARIVGIISQNGVDRNKFDGWVKETWGVIFNELNETQANELEDKLIEKYNLMK